MKCFKTLKWVPKIKGPTEKLNNPKMFLFSPDLYYFGQKRPPKSSVTVPLKQDKRIIIRIKIHNFKVKIKSNRDKPTSVKNWYRAKDTYPATKETETEPQHQIIDTQQKRHIQQLKRQKQNHNTKEFIHTKRDTSRNLRYRDKATTPKNWYTPKETHPETEDTETEPQQQRIDTQQTRHIQQLKWQKHSNREKATKQRQIPTSRDRYPWAETDTHDQKQIPMSKSRYPWAEADTHEQRQIHRSRQ